jgi:hypothetical protein
MRMLKPEMEISLLLSLAIPSFCDKRNLISRGAAEEKKG